MTTPIRSIGELRALRKRLVDLRRIGPAVATRVAATFSAIALRDFDAKRSPSGAAWKPNKSTGRIPTLHKSGTLERAATAFRALGSVVRLSVLGVRYAKYQQPSRFVPSKKLSPEHRAIVESTAEEEIVRTLRGAA